MGLCVELGVGNRLVFDNPSVRVHLDDVFAEHQGVPLWIEPRFTVYPEVVQELLGHATIAITLGTCSYMLLNMQGEAAASAMESTVS